MNLAQSTCNLHQDRSASARCPSCKLFFCSECITEHDGKLTCAECLKIEESPTTTESNKWSNFLQVMPVIQLLIAVFFTWITFYLVAQILMDIPDRFHDGTIWKQEVKSDTEKEDKTKE